MPTIQKLKENLTQSERWGNGFREEIKKLMEEVSIKNKEIAVARRASLDAEEQIQKIKCELKGIQEEKQRWNYKKDKLTIKLNELDARIAVYQEAVNKKTHWNQELTKRLQTIQKNIEEQQNLNAIEDMFEGVSESKVSVFSCNSNSDAKSFHSTSSKHSKHSQIDADLTKLKELESNYLQLTSKCRQKEEELDRQRKIQLKLKDKLQRMEGEDMELNNSNKENALQEANQNLPQEPNKQIKTAVQKVKELEEKSKHLDQRIQEERDWVNKYTQHLETLAQCQGQAQPIRTATIAAQRQAKKQKKAIATICSYILQSQT